MPLGTLDRDPPPFFRQGPSALSKLAVCSALALLLMVADARFKVMQPLRVALAAVLYPVQWLALQPVELAGRMGNYFPRSPPQRRPRKKLAANSASSRSGPTRLSSWSWRTSACASCWICRNACTTDFRAAQVIYEAADPYTRKVIIDKGLMHRMVVGSPVLDEAGVIGQITNVYPLVSEVTLITDRDHAIPVLNVRTGARGVAFGDTSTHADALELRYMAANADVAVGDLLTTSGVDGVYPRACR